MHVYYVPALLGGPSVATPIALTANVACGAQISSARLYVAILAASARYIWSWTDRAPVISAAT